GRPAVRRRCQETPGRERAAMNSTVHGKAPRGWRVTVITAKRSRHQGPGVLNKTSPTNLRSIVCQADCHVAPARPEPVDGLAQIRFRRTAGPRPFWFLALN